MASFSLKHEQSSKCCSLNSPVFVKKYSRSQKLRAEALGWDGWKKEPFEANQSLMNNFQYKATEEGGKMEAAKMYNIPAFEIDKSTKISPLHASGNSHEISSLSDDFLINVPSFSTSVLFESNSSYLSTSKAIFTIHLPTSQILVVNSAACQLINYSTDELCSMKLENIVQESYKKKLYSLQENFCRESNKVPFNGGKLLELVRKNGETISVFLYLKNINNPQRCLAIAEPLDQKTALVTVDESGKILTYDEDTALIFHYDPSELVGVNIHVLLPGLSISKDNEQLWKPGGKQKLTGKTKKGEVFPVCVTVNSNQSSEVFKIFICIYTGLSGLILLNRKLLITNFNATFVKLLFGYSKKDIINQPITNLIPAFGKDVEWDKSKKGRNGMVNLTNDLNLGDWYEKNESHQASPISENSKNDCIHSLKSTTSPSFNNSSDPFKRLAGSYLDSKTDSESSLNTYFKFNIEENTEEREGVKLRHNALFQGKANTNRQVVDLLKVDEEIKGCEINSENKTQEGKFLGFGKHRDGNYFEIKYQVRVAVLNEEFFYYIWLSRDVQKFQETTKGLNGISAMASSFNSVSLDGSLPKESICSEQCTRPSTASMTSQCDENLTAGEYSQYYTNIRQIGKGAFGYVKMAFRNADGLLVVTKFIKKQKINIRSWVFHSNLNMKIPLEVSLLTTLQHPNIVKVLDVFHNESFVQLVMEKHGAGFDLFEFIDRGPKCDEKLKSYIFRQIISAVHYLNSLGILHRDIKDENVIINEKFEVKLIDFGSATFMPPDESFSKFYGTVEYCSPEVLQGNTYKGPELEIWALGVTLYVLTFGNNPFYNIEEIIKAHFTIPLPISEELNDLLHKMLDKNIETRITIDKVVKDPWINQPVLIENYRFEDVVRCYDEEAYPPKYVYEINSEDLYSRVDSHADSDQMLDTNNSNSSLQNIPIEELGDLEDNFQDLHKVGKLELVVDRKDISPILFSSTPMQKKNDRLCKSSVGLRRQLENSLCLNENRHSSSVGNELHLRENTTNNLNYSSNDSNNVQEDEVLSEFDDCTDAEFEVRFSRALSLDKKNLSSKTSSDSEDRRTLSLEGYEFREDNDEYLIDEQKSFSDCKSSN